MAKLTGGEGNDKITGTEQADTIDGRFGNDMLSGLGGDDAISGSDGNDTINGGSGNDNIDGGNGDDTIFGGSGDDYIVGNSLGFDTIFGEDGNDTILDVNEGKIYGGNGNDSLADAGRAPYGTFIINGNIEFYGGDGDDSIFSYTADVLDGGAGSDTIDTITIYDPSWNAPTKVDGGDGYDLLRLWGGQSGEFYSKFLDWNNVYGFEEIDFSNLRVLGLHLVLVNGKEIIELLYALEITDNVGQAGETLKLLNLYVSIDCSAETDANLFVTVAGHGSVIGGQVGDTIDATQANEYCGLDGQAGDDTISGSSYADIISGGTGSDTINAGAGGDTITGGTDIDTINAGAGNDTISGDTGNDTIDAGADSDIITGGQGDDYIDGGDGLDTAIYSSAYANYTVTEVTYNTFTVTDTIGTDGTDTIIDVNKLQFSDQTVDVVIRGFEIIGDDSAEQFTGGSFADHLDGAGGNDALSGAGGNDLIEGGTGADAVSGGSGNDLLHGDDGNDQLSGGTGDDMLDGGTGNDTLTAGDGNDTVSAGAGDDVIVGGHGAGNDTYDGGDGADTVRYLSALSGIVVDLAACKNQARSIAPLDAAGIGVDQLHGIENVTGGNFSDRLLGNEANNTLMGGTGNDILTGRDGNDTLDGGAGDDKMLGGAGNDRYVVDSAKDRVYETVSTAGTDIRDAGGVDTITSSISFNLAASSGTSFVENLALTGAANLSGRGNDLANTITGNGGSNVLFGNGGDDSLFGGAGADRLVGGAGSDTLRGGAGHDSFLLDGAANAQTNLDKILDFSRVQGDKVLLSLSAYAGLEAVGKLAAERFYAAAGATQAHDASDLIIYDKTSGMVYYDADGVGGASSVAIAVLGASAHPALAFDDFLIVA